MPVRWKLPVKLTMLLCLEEVSFNKFEFVLVVKKQLFVNKQMLEYQNY